MYGWFSCGALYVPYIHTYTYVYTSRLDAFACRWIRAVVQLYFRMSWIYRAREVAEHEVYSLCHYRRFNEFQSLFRRQDNLIGRSGDSDTPPPPLPVCRTCVFEFFDRSENNGGATAFQSSPDNACLSCYRVSSGKRLISRVLIFMATPTTRRGRSSVRLSR